MTTTLIFKSGNSQAVRTPSDIAYSRKDLVLEIERVGDEIRIRPVAKKLTGVLVKFGKFSSGFMQEGRGKIEEAEREKL